MSTPNAHERIPAFTIGDRLRKAREKTGLDQGEFAEEIGVSRGTVSNYEHATSADGLKKPYLMAWSMRTDTPLEWLQDGTVETSPPTQPGHAADELTTLTESKRGRVRGRSGAATAGYRAA